jgi:hypothetical protein
VVAVASATPVWPDCKYCTFHNLDSQCIRLKRCEMCGEQNP